MTDNQNSNQGTGLIGDDDLTANKTVEVQNNSIKAEETPKWLADAGKKPEMVVMEDIELGALVNLPKVSKKIEGPIKLRSEKPSSADLGLDPSSSIKVTKILK